MKLSKSKVYFRADGSQLIGLGHLVRCIALAHMLKSDFNITFFCKEVPKILIKEFKENKFEFILLSEEEDFFNTLTKNIIVVLDGYSFDLEYQLKIKYKEAKLVCIDDLHDKEFVADLIINHAPGVKPSDYKAQSHTQFALGLEYALLRPAFLEQAKKERVIENIDTVLICFGGSDFKNLTKRALKIVLPFNDFKKIIVVTGVAFQSSKSFSSLIKSDKRIVHLINLNDKQMLDAMLEAQLVIVPASGILLEAISIGCITISGSYIKNQNEILKGFNSLNAIYNTKNFTSLNLILERALNEYNLSRKKYIDGFSDYRLIKQFKLL